MIWFWLLAIFIAIGTWVGGFFLEWALWLKILLTVFAVLIVVGAYSFRRIRAALRDKALERELMKQAEAQAMNARPDRRAEIAQLQVQFQRGIASLRQSRLGSGKQTALYALPWYMLVGPPGAGKTTALRHSGLPFPVLDGDGKGLRGIGGTRNCDWWFTNEAILLDTAGRYATEADDHDEWISFLDLLRRYRPQKPINGVLVAVSITDLLESNEEQLDAFARRLRGRVDEVMSRLQMVVPVYVVLTKVDLIDGFVEFWGDLRKSERSQVWGMTFPLAGSNERDPSKTFQEEFGRLVSTLHARGVRRLATERNPEARTKIFQFAAEFKAIEPNVAEFISSLFQKNQFSETPVFRGVYFTSGTQEGRPLSRVVSGMLRAFNLGAAPVTPEQPQVEAKSYFLTDVFRRVVFPDQNVAGRTEGELRRQMIQRIGFAAAAFLLAMMVLLPSSCTFLRNRELIDTSEKLALDASKVNWADTNVGVVDKAKRLDDMRGQLKQLDDWRQNGAPIAYRWGMYAGNDLYESFRSAYVANLQTAFAIPSKARLEDELRGVGDAALTTEQYNTHFNRLRAYLEACDLEHLETEWEPAALTDAWGRALNANQKADKDILKQHVQYYVELMKRKEIPLWHCDANLVNRVRSVLRRLSQADRDYSALVRDANENVAPITRDTVFLNTAFGSYVTSKSKPEIVVPGAFTKLGWELYVRDRLGKDRAKQLAADRWVLGDAQQISIEQMEKLLKDVAQRYFANFNIAWADFIKDLEVRKPESNQDALEELSALSEVPWPYLRLTRVLAENVRLEESPSDQALRKLEQGTLNEVKRELEKDSRVQRVERVLGMDGGAPTTAPKRWISPPEQAFKPIIDFGLPPDLPAGQEPTAQQSQQTRLAHYQDRIIAKLVGVLTDLRDSKGRGVDSKAVASAFEESIRGTNELLTGSQSGFTRPLISPLLLNPIELSYGGVLQDQGGTMSGNWELDVWRKWHERLEDGYPFTDTWKDVSLADYTEFFKPNNGLLFGFYEKNLRGALELQGKNFVPTTRFNQAIGFTGPFLKCYDRGLEFQKATFPDGAEAPGVEFDINLHSVSDNVAEVTFDIDGAARTYKNEPEEWLTVSWPAKKPEAAGARVRIRGFSGLFEEIARPGEWGLYRLLDSATKIESGTLGGRAGATPTMVVTWNLKSQAAVVKMDVKPSKRDSVFPPYVTKKERMFRNYDCPRLIYRGVKGR